LKSNITNLGAIHSDSNGKSDHRHCPHEARHLNLPAFLLSGAKMCYYRTMNCETFQITSMWNADG
jgi:hypothetical protein